MTEELKEQDIRLNKLCFDYHERGKRIAELEKDKCELLGLIQGKDKVIAEAKDIIEDLITKIPASLVAHFESEKERAEKFLGWGSNLWIV